MDKERETNLRNASLAVLPAIRIGKFPDGLLESVMSNNHLTFEDLPDLERLSLKLYFGEIDRRVENHGVVLKLHRAYMDFRADIYVTELRIRVFLKKLGLK